MKPSIPIELPFTREAAIYVLNLGADPGQLIYSHKQMLNGVTGSGACTWILMQSLISKN